MTRPTSGRRLAGIKSAALVLTGFCAGVVLTAAAGAVAKPRPNPYERLNTLGKVLSYIERSFVEPVDQQALIDAGIKGMVSSLDPYSRWLTPQEHADLKREYQGDFVGVGLELSLKDAGLTVVTAIEGAPAAKAGARAGDILMSINGVECRSWTPQKAIGKLRGPKGSEVDLVVARAGNSEAERRHELKVKRAVIQFDAVVHQTLSPGVGYIRLRAFQEGVVGDIEAILEAMKTTQPETKGLVLDLRNNPGGFFLEAVQVADLFIDSGTIVTTTGRHEQQTEVFEARSDTTIFDLPLAVLVNENSASSSELLAGALKDRGRAAIVGQKTFGKGTVQTFVDMKDGSALKLTTARYLTPAQKPIEGKGIEVDIAVSQPVVVDFGGPDWQRQDVQLRMAHAHLKSISKMAGDKE